VPETAEAKVRQARTGATVCDPGGEKKAEEREEEKGQEMMLMWCDLLLSSRVESLKGDFL